LVSSQLNYTEYTLRNNFILKYKIYTSINKNANVEIVILSPSKFRRSIPPFSPAYFPQPLPVSLAQLPTSTDYQ
jgi:hypothetical protein